VTEITYLPEVECVISVANGLLDTQVVGVPDESGNYQYLRVGKGSVTQENDKTYLPIGIVEVDYRKRRVLIELPYEASSGAHRLWVPFSRFRQQRETP
jgi:hypothetical protein